MYSIFLFDRPISREVALVISLEKLWREKSKTAAIFSPPFGYLHVWPVNGSKEGVETNNSGGTNPVPKHRCDVIHVAALLNPTRACLRAAAGSTIARNHFKYNLESRRCLFAEDARCPQQVDGQPINGQLCGYHQSNVYELYVQAKHTRMAPCLLVLCEMVSVES